MAAPSTPVQPKAPNPFDPSFSYEADKNLFLFTSLTAGSSHIVTATSRMETILKANRVPYFAIDCATDEKARRIWMRRGAGKRLPGLVREGMVLGDIEKVEEWNEFGEIKLKLGGPPLPKKVIPARPPGPSNSSKTSAVAKKENLAPAVIPTAPAMPPASSGPTTRTREETVTEVEQEKPKEKAGQASLASEVAAAALKRKQEKAAALKAKYAGKDGESKAGSVDEQPAEDVSVDAVSTTSSIRAQDSPSMAPDRKMVEPCTAGALEGNPEADVATAPETHDTTPLDAEKIKSDSAPLDTGREDPIATDVDIDHGTKRPKSTNGDAAAEQPLETESANKSGKVAVSNNVVHEDDTKPQHDITEEPRGAAPDAKSGDIAVLKAAEDDTIADSSHETAGHSLDAVSARMSRPIFIPSDVGDASQVADRKTELENEAVHQVSDTALATTFGKGALSEHSGNGNADTEAKIVPNHESPKSVTQGVVSKEAELPEEHKSKMNALSSPAAAGENHESDAPSLHDLNDFHKEATSSKVKIREDRNDDTKKNERIDDGEDVEKEGEARDADNDPNDGQTAHKAT